MSSIPRQVRSITDALPLISADLPPLILAILESDEDRVRALLQSEHTHPNTSNRRGETALIEACWRGIEACSRVLLQDERTDPNLKDKNLGNTALFAAIYGDWTACVKVLLKNRRTDPNIRDGDECTALMVAAKIGSIDCLKEFLKDGRIDPNAKDLAGKTALLYATREGRLDCVRALLQDGRADPNAHYDGGKTALMSAAQAGKEICMRALLKDGRIDLNAKDFSQKTALMYAIPKNFSITHELCIKLLLLYGANPRLENNIRMQAKDMTQDPLLKNLLAHPNPKEVIASLKSLSARYVLLHEIDPSPLPDLLKNNLFEIAITGKCAYQLSEES